jgi:hypothetical protein
VSRIAAGAFLSIALLLALLTSGVFPMMRRPGCVLSTPYGSVQLGAVETGVGLVADRDSRRYDVGIQFVGNGPLRMSSEGGYSLNALGFGAAILLKSHHTTCYLEYPFVGVLLPYWFLITASGVWLIRVTPLAGWIGRHARPTVGSGIAAIIVFAFFLFMNVVPSISGNGARERMMTYRDWLTMTGNPQLFYSHVQLNYGFPFRCYSQGFRNGNIDRFYLGSEMGWEPRKVMENLCLAALASFSALPAVRNSIK